MDNNTSASAKPTHNLRWFVNWFSSSHPKFKIAMCTNYNNNKKPHINVIIKLNYMSSIARPIISIFDKFFSKFVSFISVSNNRITLHLNQLMHPFSILHHYNHHHCNWIDKNCFYCAFFFSSLYLHHLNWKYFFFFIFFILMTILNWALCIN